VKEEKEVLVAVDVDAVAEAVDVVEETNLVKEREDADVVAVAEAVVDAVEKVVLVVTSLRTGSQ
jgi:hypothetical protein